MKYVLATMAVLGFLALAMVGWSVAGRFMTAKDDTSVAMGLLIIGVILGLVVAGIGFVIRRIAKALSDPASLDQHRDEKQ